MILGWVGIYLLIGLIIFLILHYKGKIEENIGSEILFIRDDELWIIYGFLALFIMLLWLPIVLWILIDLLVGIYYFNGEKNEKR